MMTAALGAMLLSACQTPPSPAPGTRVNWPGVPFKEVRAYCYDYTAEARSSFWAQGRMHQGVMDPKGVKLSPAQVQRLLADITVSQPAATRTNCYKPHHAFMFFDAKGQVVAVFEMCFGCNQFVATPGGLPEYIDYKKLYQLTHDLGLPLGTGNEFYTQACRGGVKDRR
ncbi:MAG: hypothetical protein K8R87_09610 [Verrucomicrobia bacterium]|nr:hypothetical protein [Verrucomicrobiota bacterium]